MSVPAMRNQRMGLMPIGQELDQIVAVCKTLATCPFYQKIGPGGVLAIWLTARELNLPTMMCLNGGLYTFDGKVTMSAQLMNMMIVNAGHEANVVYLDETGCKIRFVRSDRKGPNAVFEYEFTRKHAEKAGYFGRYNARGEILSKPKDNWVNHERDMYFSRALSGGARKFMPDVLMNCYVFGEIEDMGDEHLVNVMPDIAVDPVPNTSQLPESNESVEPPKLDYVPQETIEQFKVKYGIGNDNDHDRYINVLSEKCKKTKDEMIVCAVMNEQGFVDAFKKWEANLPKIEEKKSKKPKTEEITPEK